MQQAMSTTLIERLAEAHHGRPRSQVFDAEAHLASILGNLRAILNTRLGSQSHPDLGIPPPYELLVGYPHTAAELLRSIAYCIERYEPRLQDVRVTPLAREEHELQLRFRVSAAVSALGGQRLGFETTLDQSGRFQCRSND